MIDTLDKALKKQGETLKALDVWKETMPTEAEMLPKDKYTMFDRKEKRYRKGIHSKCGFDVLRGFEVIYTHCYTECADHVRFSRAAEVDESFSESKPAWLLDIARDGFWWTIGDFKSEVWRLLRTTDFDLIVHYDGLRRREAAVPSVHIRIFMNGWN